MEPTTMLSLNREISVLKLPTEQEHEWQQTTKRKIYACLPGHIQRAGLQP